MHLMQTRTPACMHLHCPQEQALFCVTDCAARHMSGPQGGPGGPSRGSTRTRLPSMQFCSTSRLSDGRLSASEAVAEQEDQGAHAGDHKARGLGDRRRRSASNVKGRLGCSNSNSTPGPVRDSLIRTRNSGHHRAGGIPTNADVRRGVMRPQPQPVGCAGHQVRMCLGVLGENHARGTVTDVRHSDR